MKRVTETHVPPETLTLLAGLEKIAIASCSQQNRRKQEDIQVGTKRWWDKQVLAIETMTILLRLSSSTSPGFLRLYSDLDKGM